MSEPKFTPGPWTWTMLEAPQCVPESTLDGPDVLCRYWYNKPPSPDARLIAAAPAMYAALKDLIAQTAEAHSACSKEYCNSEGGCGVVFEPNFEQVLAALALAEGKAVAP